MDKKSNFSSRILRTSLAVAGLLGVALLGQGCTGVNVYPYSARLGDTLSLMLGGTEEARRATVSVVLEQGGTTWDLNDPNGDLDTSDSLIRSVFNLRPDGTANGIHYSSFLGRYLPWDSRHEPVQAVVVMDLPSEADLIAAGMPVPQPGGATLTVVRGASGDSSGAADPFVVNVNILSGVGSPDDFLRQDSGGQSAASFADLESAPYLKIDFRTIDGTVSAVSLDLSFDSNPTTGINPDDLNVYFPESTVRGNIVTDGAFGATQRMVYWSVSNDTLTNTGNLHIDIIAPQGINTYYLLGYVVHPRSVTSPGFGAVTSDVFDQSGALIGNTMPLLEYCGDNVACAAL